MPVDGGSYYARVKNFMSEAYSKTAEIIVHGKKK